ncbi:hypothetical protein IFM89_026685 [Coptis chinensis]|uniref:AP2/ERF domain-containing protein n=1 Tax=Coptis chinensis TaxID=261450 RepID=A0A835LRM9_9MAGN|nr:hypothetical protein IFM89_026685 [Coptis chinensis]
MINGYVKFVNQIRSQRIWLGTYETAEMATRAHDVAVLALRGSISRIYDGMENVAPSRKDNVVYMDDEIEYGTHGLLADMAKTVEIKVKMDCDGCERRVKSYVSSMKGSIAKL